MSKKAIAHLASISPYSQSKFHNSEKLNKELANDYEERTWMERIHVDAEGKTYIPPMAFKNCVSEVAKFLGEQVPGKGKATWTKHFEAGILCVTPTYLQHPDTGSFVLKDEWKGEWGFYPADGVRGSGKRVMKCYPVLHSWIGSVEFLIYDDTITESVFAKHLEQAGRLIGIGRFRPRNNGYFGRFKITELVWEDDAI
jgi:hypothetical protein